jgi:hypothetical protein
VKPTLGSFKSYRFDCLLHCGVTDSRGQVHNFDSSGVSVDPSWDLSISVELSTNLSDQEWDQVLAEHSKREKA